ncbi:MAG: hypothetical protein BRD31_03250 [Bacteroidetes bacterium QH_2_64_26]|nr:MAG: hypothetical protein BRD31_03250 [Bacteroidetes bacterium QH_2_64_26]
MSLIRRCLVDIFLCVALVGLLAGCTSTEQADENPSSSDPVTVQPEFAPSATSVRTVQLYRGDDERSLPVITLNSDEALTLEFDLMELQGRPLSVYFEHADRTWQRDLSPSQALESFHQRKLCLARDRARSTRLGVAGAALLRGGRNRGTQAAGGIDCSPGAASAVAPSDRPVSAPDRDSGRPIRPYRLLRAEWSAYRHALRGASATGATTRARIRAGTGSCLRPLYD